MGVKTLVKESLTKKYPLTEASRDKRNTNGTEMVVLATKNGLTP